MRILQSMLGGSTATMQADTGGDAAGDTEVVRKKVAKHELLDAAGAVIESEEAATGIRYTLLANSQTFDWQYGKNPDADRMLAVFGAKTLATNETSQARNNAKGEASADEQIAAVRDRFELLASGKWVDRTREGVGAKIDKDALAEAICRVLVADGKQTQEQIDGGYKAKIRAKLEDDAAYVRIARQVPKVATEYAAIVGRATKSVDDLMLV